LPAQLAQAMLAQPPQSAPSCQNCSQPSRGARHERACSRASNNNFCAIFHCFVLIRLFQLAI
jgi:hypothetical protein